LWHSVKKKFLLANKHITKYALVTSLILFGSCSLYNTRLNSTLSVRIEELNAQISTLYVENLRLKANEIALTAQLKKEQDKSRKLMADAEAAVSVTYPEDPPSVAEIS
jgi:cell division protein FtsB